mgnify:CR=1 FL=1
MNNGCGCNSMGPAIILVLFILLIIIVGAFIYGDTMEKCVKKDKCSNQTNQNYLFIIVLYILLAIILSSFIFY